MRPGIRGFIRSAMDSRQLPFPAQQATNPRVSVEINHGRWIARCPSCSGAEFGDPDHRFFFCLSCLNEEFDGKWLPTIWPGNRTAIENILLRRPRRNQNWTPGQSLTDLENENAENKGKR